VSGEHVVVGRAADNHCSNCCRDVLGWLAVYAYYDYDDEFFISGGIIKY